MAGVMNPGQRRTLMDDVAQGLAIAESVYGIKSKMDEQDYRNEQRAKETKTKEDAAANRLDDGEFRKLALTKGVELTDKGGDGAFPVYNKEGVLRTYVKQATAPKIAKGQWVETKDAKGNPVRQYVADAQPGQTLPVYVKPEKPEKQDVIAIETVDDKGNTVTQLVPKVAGSSYAKPNKGGTADDAFKKLSKPAQIAVTKLTEDNTKRETATVQIDNQLANMKAAWEKGDEDLAVKQGSEMLKILNSDVGADAVGAEESKRLGSFLENKIANFTGPGSFFGRDVEKFFEQAAQKNNSMKQTIMTNRKKVDELLAGKPAEDLQLTGTEIGPKGGSGTALAKEPPKPGTVIDGYEFLGGDPGDQKNWREVKK